MNVDQVTVEARARFPKTIEQIEAGEIYPHCPRCRGSRMISVCTDPGGDYRPSQWEYVTCPCCRGAGEADAEEALAFIEQWEEREDLR